MNKNKKLLKLFLGFFIFSSFLKKSDASPVLQSGELIEGKSWSLSLIGSSVKKEPVVKISGTDSIQIPTSGGSATVFSNSNAEIELEQEYKAGIFNLEFRPQEGLQYRARFGQVDGFSLEFSSGSHTNKFESTDLGFLWGVGISGRIVPGSMVSTAIKWDLCYTEIRSDLDRFDSADAVTSSDAEFREREYQGSILFSQRWKELEPFGGLKILRTVSQIRDNGTKGRVTGTEDNVSPVVGLKWNFFNRESVMVEASFVGEESISAGVQVQF
jgi:hypothetical protein